MPRLLSNITLLLLLLGQTGQLHAHALGENYLFLDVLPDALSGRLEIHERELDAAFGIALSGPAVPSRETLRVVFDYVDQHLGISVAGEPLPLTFDAIEVLDLPQGRFVQLGFTAPWPAELPTALTIRQDLFFELDARHRGLILIEHNAVTGEETGWEKTALVFSPHQSVQELDLLDVPSLSGRREFLFQGTWHILIGYDHVLFLLTLLLTSVLVRSGRSWQPEQHFKRAFWNVAAIVSLFTLAHSVTLTLAALGLVNVSSLLVESVIALSIIVMALHNIRPFLPNQWVVIFLFGLFHGLGFATVMEHLSFRMVDLVTVMVLFNVGIELGQLAIVAVSFPLLFAIRRRSWYIPVVLVGGSTVIALVAAFWLFERVAGG